LDTAKLLVSELVTNALLHGHGAIAVRARLRQDRLFVEITDEGRGFSWTTPEQDRDRRNGWGLLLVDTESDRWGMHEDHTRVWFELAV
jgi:anti-sigma regulatory factor (Ser/Thr protein kinase)